LQLSGIVMVAAFAASPAFALTQQEILNYKGADRDKMLLEGARKEGEVVFYSGMIVNQALRPIAEAFGKKYPGVKLTFWRADSDAIVTKLSAEQHAGNMVGDVMEGTGIGELAVEAKLAQPFQTPLLDEYDEQYRDPRHLWAPTRLSYFGIAYNTRQVKSEQAPHAYEDLLDPRWKGKMAWSFGPATGAGLFITTVRLTMGEDKAMAYFKKLAQQNIANLSETARAVVDKVVAGEYALGVSIYAHHPLISKAKGAPVDTALIPPVASAAGTMLISANAPHPHAAMLLVDFILSKEGQGILAKSQYFPARSDVPALPELEPIVPKNKGLKQLFIDPEKLQKYDESSENILKEVFRR
jgi:ABC-type Fe3+ transport system substrate-binding protein